MHRRGFLAGSACTALAASRAGAANTTLRLTIDPAAAAGAIGPDFTGLSFETAQLANSRYFAAKNEGLVAYFRLLSPAGVLRIGGNTSAFSVWSPQGAPESSETFGPDTGRKAAPKRPVTPAAIRNLRTFLDATGWSLVYGLNLGGGTPEIAADEADTVMRMCGGKLIAFQLCNEPDLFSRNGVRDPGYDYPRFATEWRAMHVAVKARVPGARFAGPDSAFNNDWLVPFAREFKPEVQFLSQHYYALGPPTDPSMNIERLLGHDPKLDVQFDGMRKTREETGLPFRMAETNSCWGGGKEGVSDTFAAALWGGELMLKVAAAGGAAINFHGGGNGWYTPIAGAAETGFSARPLFYAMLMISTAGPGTLVRVSVEGGGPLVSAFALRAADGTLKLIAFNKNAGRDVRLALEGNRAASASLLRLRAPGLAAKAAVTLGGAEIVSGAKWSPHAETVSVKGQFVLDLPHASAVMATLRG